MTHFGVCETEWFQREIHLALKFSALQPAGLSFGKQTVVVSVTESTKRRVKLTKHHIHGTESSKEEEKKNKDNYDTFLFCLQNYDLKRILHETVMSPFQATRITNHRRQSFSLSQIDGTQMLLHTYNISNLQ
jgi:hypothetical protein